MVVRGWLVLVRHDREVTRSPLDIPESALNIEVVDDISRLQLAAKRAGYEVRLIDVCPRVRELLELAGLGHWIQVER